MKFVLLWLFVSLLIHCTWYKNNRANNSTKPGQIIAWHFRRCESDSKSDIEIFLLSAPLGRPNCVIMTVIHLSCLRSQSLGRWASTLLIFRTTYTPANRCLFRTTKHKMEPETPTPSSQQPLLRSASREPLLPLQIRPPSLKTVPQLKSQYPTSDQSSKHRPSIGASQSPRSGQSSENGSGYRADDEDSWENPSRFGSGSGSSRRSSDEGLDICDRLNNTVFCRNGEGCKAYCVVSWMAVRQMDNRRDDWLYWVYNLALGW